jgi:uncharacterized phiE125 gp8 family phage protein
MGLRKLVEATVEPVTLSEAKAHLRAIGTSDDTYITALITAARQICEDKVQRTLLQTDWELTLDAFPCAIPLRMPRVMSVLEVAYLDEAGASQVLAPSDYLVDDKSEPGWIVPAYGLAWPATRDQPNAVTVEYRCGYGASASLVPAPIKSWILLMIGALYENRETVTVAPGVVAVELGFADRLLDTYRVWAL